MKIVANCILRHGDQLLMLQKPRRGWWVVPGGKMEPGESIYETVMREYREETGLNLNDPELRGVFTVLVENDENIDEHWMLFTFYTESFNGQMHTFSEEGTLEWVNIESLQDRPMAEGDRIFLQYIVNSTSLLTGKFRYTADYQLLGWTPECTMTVLN